MDALLDTQGHHHVSDWAATKDLVYGPNASVGVCVDVHSYCITEGPVDVWSLGPLPVTMLLSGSVALPQSGCTLIDVLVTY